VRINGLRHSSGVALCREAEAAKRAALEKQRAAQGLGPQGQQAERELQAATAEIEANKRCVCPFKVCEEGCCEHVCCTLWFRV
jgi:hypothetical protein